MQERFVYVYLRNPLSDEQIQDIDRWLHQYCHEVSGKAGHWQFKMGHDGPEQREAIKMNLDETLPQSPDQEQVAHLNDCLGYVPRQTLGLCAVEEKQLQLSTLAQTLATKFEGIVHYEIPHA